MMKRILVGKKPLINRVLSRDVEPPKDKCTGSFLKEIETHLEKDGSCQWLVEKLQTRPLLTHSVVGFKSLWLIHKTTLMPGIDPRILSTFQQTLHQMSLSWNRRSDSNVCPIVPGAEGEEDEKKLQKIIVVYSDFIKVRCEVLTLLKDTVDCYWKLRVDPETFCIRATEPDLKSTIEQLTRAGNCAATLLEELLDRKSSAFFCLHVMSLTDTLEESTSILKTFVDVLQCIESLFPASTYSNRSKNSGGHNNILHELIPTIETPVAYFVSRLYKSLEIAYALELRYPNLGIIFKKAKHTYDLSIPILMRVFRNKQLFKSTYAASTSAALFSTIGGSTSPASIKLTTKNDQKLAEPSGIEDDDIQTAAPNFGYSSSSNSFPFKKQSNLSSSSSAYYLQLTPEECRKTSSNLNIPHPQVAVNTKKPVVDACLISKPNQTFHKPSNLNNRASPSFKPLQQPDASNATTFIFSHENKQRSHEYRTCGEPFNEQRGGSENNDLHYNSYNNNDNKHQHEQNKNYYNAHILKQSSNSKSKSLEKYHNADNLKNTINHKQLDDQEKLFSNDINVKQKLPSLITTIGGSAKNHVLLPYSPTAKKGSLEQHELIKYNNPIENGLNNDAGLCSEHQYYNIHFPTEGNRQEYVDENTNPKYFYKVDQNSKFHHNEIKTTPTLNYPNIEDNKICFDEIAKFKNGYNLQQQEKNDLSIPCGVYQIPYKYNNNHDLFKNTDNTVNLSSNLNISRNDDDDDDDDDRIHSTAPFPNPFCVSKSKNHSSRFNKTSQPLDLTKKHSHTESHKRIGDMLVPTSKKDATNSEWITTTMLSSIPVQSYKTYHVLRPATVECPQPSYQHKTSSTKKLSPLSGKQNYQSPSAHGIDQRQIGPISPPNYHHQFDSVPSNIAIQNHHHHHHHNNNNNNNNIKHKESVPFQPPPQIHMNPSQRNTITQRNYDENSIPVNNNKSQKNHRECDYPRRPTTITFPPPQQQQQYTKTNGGITKTASHRRPMSHCVLENKDCQKQPVCYNNNNNDNADTVSHYIIRKNNNKIDQYKRPSTTSYLTINQDSSKINVYSGNHHTISAKAKKSALPPEIPIMIPQTSSSSLIPIQQQYRLPKTTLLTENDNESNITDLEVDLSQVAISGLIGRGSTSQVFKGIWRGAPVAVKHLQSDHRHQYKKRPKGILKEFYRELGIMLRLRHPNLVLFMGANTKGETLCVITEYCEGGNLFEMLHGKKRKPSELRRPSIYLTWKQKIKICTDIARACQYLHTATPPILHRDLKSLNILLASPVTSSTDVPVAKVSDFGLSRIKAGLSETWGPLTGMAGTYYWMAPEVILNQPYNEKADVYSFSIVMYEVLSQTIPYSDPTRKTTHTSPVSVAVEVSQGRRPDLCTISNDCPSKLITLMQNCWSTNPVDRPSFAEIVGILAED